MRAFLASLACLTITTAANAQEPKLHALFVIDTHAHGIGQFVQWDRYNILRSVHGGFRDAGKESRLSWKVLEGPEATPANVLRHLSTLRPSADDAVLVYYAGHGAVDAARGHFLKMRYGALYRTTLQSALGKHKVRLSVLLTESCAVVEPSPPPHLTLRPGGPPTGNWETLSRLFLEGKGKVDINSCRPNQVAVASTGTGAFFTHSLAGVLCQPGTSEKMTWEAAIRQTEQKMSGLIPKGRQGAYVYSMPRSTPAGKPPEPQQGQVVWHTTDHHKAAWSWRNNPQGSPPPPPAVPSK